jgi:hypothetical protein
MELLYRTLGTRFTRLLVENITIGFNQQPSFPLSCITALHKKHFLRSTATPYGALTPLIHCHITIFQLAGWPGTYFDSHYCQTMNYCLYNGWRKINILIFIPILISVCLNCHFPNPHRFKKLLTWNGFLTLEVFFAAKMSNRQDVLQGNLNSEFRKQEWFA